MALPLSGELSVRTIGYYKSMPVSQYSLGSDIAFAYGMGRGNQTAVSSFYGRT